MRRRCPRGNVRRNVRCNVRRHVRCYVRSNVYGELMTRSVLATLLVAAACTQPAPAPTPVATTALPERAVRRDIPMTNAIRRAFAAGTRDSTGRPGHNYWQLRTDYTINV